tara:strand:- start:10617 stop:14309 length:3693 start_codon:yes stop_codon:yes gene_type:complete
MNKIVKFQNKLFNKKELKNVIYEAFINYGAARASYLADELKELGFHYATKAGISISIEDLKVPPIKKNSLIEASKEIQISDKKYNRGEINMIERFENVTYVWNNTSENLKNDLVTYFKTTDPFNSIYLMAFSGARGNLSQVRQLVGMRGLMSDSKGQIMDIPIIRNFREGLTITDYIMSSYGARKGVVDTALRTADSGYLTRRLIDVAQDVIIREEDCFTRRALNIYSHKFKESNFVGKITGRIAAKKIICPNSKELLVRRNQEISSEIAKKLFRLKIEIVSIRSPLTCEATRSICQKCYGHNLAYGKLVDLGEAVGIIAAQSIGEPGTQLTMRTFHTGGIFTAKLKRQIHAQNAGLVSLNKDIQTQEARTMFGKNILLLKKETTITITNYKNESSKIKLIPNSSIFIKDNNYVKKKELLAELPLTNQQTLQAKKNILSPVSGEVFFKPNSNVIWILNGDIYNLISASLVNKFYKNNIKTENDSLINFKLTSKTEGIVKIGQNKIDNSLETIKILNCLQFFNIPLYKDKISSKLVLINNNSEKYTIEELPQNLNSRSILFAKGKLKKYQIPCDGNIYYKNSNFFKSNKKRKEKIIKKSGKIFFIPKEIKTINKSSNLLLITNGDVLNNPKTELTKGIFSNIAGLAEIKEANKIVQQITIRPGKFYEYLYLKPKEKEELLKLDKKIFFPGEIIFDELIVNDMSYLEVTKIENRLGLLLRPIYEFNIPKPRANQNSRILHKNQFSNKLKLINSHFIKLKSESLIQKTKNYALLGSFISLKYKKIKIGAKPNLKWKVLKNSENCHSLILITKEVIDLINFIPQKIKTEKLKLSTYVKEGQFVEPYTILAKLSILSSETLTITNIKKRLTPSPRVMLVNENNYRLYYNEQNNFLVKKNEMLRTGDKITPNLRIKDCGQVLDILPFKFKIHKGTPIFLTEQTYVYIKPSALIKTEDVIGEVTYEQVITGDIVQGLPKVEEILEARKPQDEAYLAETSGLVYDINENTISLIGIFKTFNKNSKSTYKHQINLKKNEKSFIINKQDYIYIGEPITGGIINPHDLLVTYFNYYKTIHSEYEAAYFSFKKIQNLLIRKVQEVYQSQGVAIADKHIEIIIRQITSKVEIITTGSTLLHSNELIDLKQIKYINAIMRKTERHPASYNPVLLGITKVSLLSESFISAASFQETTRILTTAAIEGKIDWLRGLKENVIIGHLIPAGTGFEHKPNLKLNMTEIT